MCIFRDLAVEMTKQVSIIPFVFFNSFCKIDKKRRVLTLSKMDFCYFFSQVAEILKTMLMTKTNKFYPPSRGVIIVEAILIFGGITIASC